MTLLSNVCQDIKSDLCSLTLCTCDISLWTRPDERNKLKMEWKLISYNGRTCSISRWWLVATGPPWIYYRHEEHDSALAYSCPTVQKKTCKGWSLAEETSKRLVHSGFQISPTKTQRLPTSSVRYSVTHTSVLVSG